MKTVLIDAEKMKDRDFHQYFKRRLELKGYHGNNLDAMYDVLSTLREELRIYAYNFQEETLSDYGRSIWRTLKELEVQKDNIHLKTINISRRY
ncbi:barstar family protein [Gudongella sp. SC589]|jgi:RNAse (barnase) inhibitor barstar|uniref:barstar family protein n=1 Tax=Gudongella sp. SC589 TaxID=3385990 RepID=UPI003904DFF3